MVIERENDMRRKITAMILLFLMLANTLSGCRNSFAGTEDESAGDTETETIRFCWWGNQERAQRTNQAVDLFMEKNPSIKVETCFFPFDTYYENLSIAAEVGNMPDIFQGFVGTNNDLMEKNLIEPLDDYVEQGLVDISDIADSLVATGKIDGKLYGIPMGCNVKCLIVDPEAYRKAGISVPEVAYLSWDALGEDLQKLKDSGLPYGGDDIFERGFTFEYFARQNGENVFSPVKEKCIGFSKDTYVNYYQYKLDWIRKGLIPPQKETRKFSNPEDSQTAKGNAAVRHCYSSEYPQILEAAGRPLQLILMPGPNTDRGTDIRPGIHLCMSAGSTHREAAAKLMDFLINDIECNKILNVDRGMPASSRVREAIMDEFDEGQKAMAEIVSLAEKHCSDPTKPAKGATWEIENISSGLMYQLEQGIIDGEITPEEAYDQIAEQYGAR